MNAADALPALYHMATSNAAGMQRDWEKANRCNELGIVLWGLTTAMVNVTEIERILMFVKKRIES